MIWRMICCISWSFINWQMMNNQATFILYFMSWCPLSYETIKTSYHSFMFPCWICLSIFCWKTLYWIIIFIIITKKYTPCKKSRKMFSLFPKKTRSLKKSPLSLWKDLFFTFFFGPFFGPFFDYGVIFHFINKQIMLSLWCLS